MQHLQESDTHVKQSPINGNPETPRDPLARLLRAAGPRPEVPKERAARVRRAVRSEWQRAVRRRRIVRWSFALAPLAAAALLFLVLRTGVEPASAGVVATLESATGPVRLEQPGTRRAQALDLGAELSGGASLSTPSGCRAALRLAGGASLRLDAETHVRLLAAGTVQLDRGAVYIDTEGVKDAAPVEVRTRHGIARDVGTQFEVRLGESALRVRVREGRVDLSREGRVESAQAGTELNLDAAGQYARREIALNGPEWGWVQEAAPPFELEGRTLGEFLAWVARETALEVRWTNPDQRSNVLSVRLHGSVRGLTPREACDAVLASCGLEFSEENGSILIQRSNQ